MIEKIDNISQFNNFNQCDIYYVRIMSLIKAYGCKYSFATFYRQLNEDLQITAIISKLDGDYTVSVLKNANQSELSEFFYTLGYSTVLCDSSLEIKSKYSDGIVMSNSNKAICEDKDFVEIDTYPKLMELFNFIDYPQTDFESWYVDISHRIRHDCAKAYTLNIDSQIISTGIFSAIYNNNAILSAVRTVPEFRNMGYASYLINRMVNDISGTVFLMRENNLNENFYKSLDFSNISKWRLYK